MEEGHLKLFLTEELYLLPKDSIPTDKAPKASVSESATEALPLNSEHTPEVLKTPIAEEATKYPIVVISESLSKDEKELMNKILMAVNVKPNQIHHIIGQPGTSLSYDKLIVFGAFEIEGVGSEYYNVTRTTQMSLRAKPLSEVNGNREEKTRLWNSLKTWFGL